MEDVKVTVNGGILESDEIAAYIKRGREQRQGVKLLAMTADVDGEYVDLSYEYDNAPFARIRRITGYLVGTLDRFNDAKRNEVMDRVTHEVVDDCEDVYFEAG